MGTNATQTSKLYGLGAGDITCFANEFSMTGEYAIDDASSICDGENVNVMGKQNVAELSAKGRYDDDTGNIAISARAQLASRSNETVAMLPLGIGAGLPLVGQHGLTTIVDVGSPADGLTTIEISGVSDVGLDLAYQLGDASTAVTIDSETAALDGGAASSDGGAAYLFITGLTGLAGVVVTIEDSATGSSGWATIATFENVITDKKGLRVAISGAIKQYTRAKIDVTGTGSVNVLVGISRNNA